MDFGIFPLMPNVKIDLLTKKYDDFLLHSDIKYGENYTSEGELYELQLDVYEPIEPSDEPRPLVILIHGGSFVDGNKEMGEVTWFCEDLAKQGIVASSINYRTETDFLSLASAESMVKAVMRAVEDAKASIRFFRKDALEDNTYNIDPGQIVIGGSSAGSIAALHTVYMNDYQNLNRQYQSWFRDLGIDTITLSGNSGNSGYSDTVSAIINISGAIAELSFLEDNFHIPAIHIHNKVDLSVPYKFGHPYFIPILPIIAGSHPIHKRLIENNGHSNLYAVPEINHVPHTLPNGSKHWQIYDNSLRKISKFLGEVLPCNEALVTSINNKQLEGVEVFPNPTNSELNITGLDNFQDFQILLYDMLGKQLAYKLSDQQPTIQLDQEKIEKGNFILKIIELKTGKSFDHLGLFE